ncbi:MAG TPA: hypothetical protein VET85_02345 [Stellaceae bacterium]|nr:hypothetical protein [Stellaceae bacterium]
MTGKPHLVLAAVMLGASAAMAQQPSPQDEPAPNVEAPPSDARQRSATPPGTGPSGRSLSHQLSRSNGVLRPPATGNDDVLHPPATGNDRMPVIPPPAATGGSGSVVPK